MPAARQWLRQRHGLPGSFLILGLAVAVLLTVAVYEVFGGSPERLPPVAAAPPAPAPAPTVTVTAPAPVPVRAASASAPTEVRVPRLGIASSLVDLQIAEDGTLEVPVDYDKAGWWTEGPTPGSAGPSIIVGHVDSKAGPAVFYRVREMVAGDEIEVSRADGSTAVFTVRETETVDKDAFPTERVYTSADGEPTLRLITCGGTFDAGRGSYRSNVVVYADLTSI